MNTIQKIELETAKLLINGNFIESGNRGMARHY